MLDICFIKKKKYKNKTEKEKKKSTIQNSLRWFMWDMERKVAGLGGGAIWVSVNLCLQGLQQMTRVLLHTEIKSKTNKYNLHKEKCVHWQALVCVSATVFGESDCKGKGAGRDRL